MTNIRAEYRYRCYFDDREYLTIYYVLYELERKNLFDLSEKIRNKLGIRASMTKCFSFFYFDTNERRLNIAQVHGLARHQVIVAQRSSSGPERVGDSNGSQKILENRSDSVAWELLASIK